MYATAIALPASASVSALKREELDKDWLTCRVNQMSGKRSRHERR
jgi:hypothetical protein